MSEANEKRLLDALGKMRESLERATEYTRVLMSERDDLLAERNQTNEADTEGQA